MARLTPSWCCDGNSATDEGWAENSGSNVSGSGDGSWGFNHWDIVSESSRVVRWMVDDARNSVGGSSGGAADGSENGDCVSSSTSDCAMSRWNNPASARHRCTTEVSVSCRSQAHHVAELTGWGGCASDNATFPCEIIRVGGGIGNSWKYKQRIKKCFLLSLPLSLTGSKGQRDQTTGESGSEHLRLTVDTSRLLPRFYTETIALSVPRKSKFHNLKLLQSRHQSCSLLKLWPVAKKKNNIFICFVSFSLIEWLVVNYRRLNVFTSNRSFEWLRILSVDNVS